MTNSIQKENLSSALRLGWADKKRNEDSFDTVFRKSSEMNQLFLIQYERGRQLATLFPDLGPTIPSDTTDPVYVKILETLNEALLKDWIL